MKKKTIIVDIETASPCVLGTTSSGISYPGTLTLYKYGRRTGKSALHLWFDNNLCKEVVLPMKPASKYKFSRDWYVADFDSANYEAVRAWCTEQFGPEDRFPNAWSRWQHRYEDQIHIRDEKDYMMFMLKWS